jgi:hypothetical protein
MNFDIKKFGFLEYLVSLSAIFVVGMLIWTASTRSAVEAKAQLVRDNHNKVVDLINNEINKCDRSEKWNNYCLGESM